MWLFSRALFASALAAILLFCPSRSHAAGAAVGDHFYEDVELLEVKGVVKSALLSTRPFGPLEAARVAAEAEEGLKLPGRDDGASDYATASAIVRRLKSAYGGGRAPSLSAAGRLSYFGKAPLHASANNNGDTYRSGLNLRASASLDARAGEYLTFNLTPYYKGDEATSSAYLLRCYAALDYKGVHLLAGRDSMWWGSSFHGALLVTDNAKPFDMIKISSTHPFVLPSFLSALGAFRPTLFLTRLESERDYPRANLLGMRLDFRPSDSFQFGLSRVLMFGGKGRRPLDAGDWLSILFASDSAEHSNSPIDGNQIVSVDASFIHVNRSTPLLPYSGLKAYMELGAEDSSGKTKSPTGRASVYGLFADAPFWLKGVDLRVEWADTAHNLRYGPAWYRHSVYTSGYRYEGNVIGHHMGGDARDLFARARWHVAPNMVIAVETDNESRGVHEGRTEKSWVGFDAEWRLEWNNSLRAGFGVEDMGGVRSKVFSAGIDAAF